MGSSIRNIRDQRYTARTWRERRESTQGEPSLQKTYDAKYTAHSSSTVPQNFSGEPSNTDFKVDAAHELLRDVIAPRIQTKSANAATVDRVYFYYYQRKKTGRRCSCYIVETSPEHQCPICLGVGVVGGYEKHGTITEILDFTSPNLVMVNVDPTFAEDTKPIYLKLKEGSNYGYVEAILPIRANIGQIDTFMTYQPIFNRGTKVIATDPLGGSAIIDNENDLIPFLNHNQIKIKIEFEKIDNRPIVSHFLLRYKILEETRIYADQSRSEENMMGTQLGFFDAYQEIDLFFDGKTIKRFNNQDILSRLDDCRKFMITSVNDNLVAGIMTSIDVRARYLLPDIDAWAKNLLV